jgi:hypothetical protein
VHHGSSNKPRLSNRMVLYTVADISAFPPKPKKGAASGKIDGTGSADGMAH